MRIGNFVLFNENVKRLSRMITGYQVKRNDADAPKKRVEGDISVGRDMNASTRIGTHRDNQEDAVLIMKYKENTKYKMMVVADGVGGNEKGEQASHIAVSEIRHWFENLEEDDFKNERHLLTLLEHKLDKINAKINRQVGDNAATTFVCALVAENYTLILNIGDSRAYIIDGKNFIQMSTDDSVANELLMSGVIECKDDMRFSNVSNMVTNNLGGGRLNVTPNIVVLKNDGYDAILLFSDGVTDCLSDDQIFAVTKWTSPKNIAHKIVEKALTNTSRREKKKSDQVKFYEEIPGGKDNTTAAVLINKRKKGGNHDDRWYYWDWGREWKQKNI